MTALQQTCPQCGWVIPIIPGYPTWCEQCKWNLEIPESRPTGGVFARPYAALGRRYSRQLYESMLSGGSPPGQSGLRRPTLALARLLAYCVAGLIYLLYLGVVGFGLWLAVFALPQAPVLGMLLGALCLALAVVMLPGPPKMRGIALPRQRYPALHRLVENVARALGCPPPDDLLYDVRYDATFGRFGWRQRRTLILGLPLLCVLEGQELVALVSQELARQVSGAPDRSLFLRTAMISLNNWYIIIHPRNRWHVRAGPAGLLLLMFNMACLPVAYLLGLIGFALSLMVWYDGQRSVYIADGLAAQVSGTQGSLGLLNKRQLGESFQSHLRFAYIQHQGQDFFASLRRFIACAPPREYARLQHVEEITHTGLNASQPPTAFRRDYLLAHYQAGARISLSYNELDRIEQELAPLLNDVTQQIFSLDELRFRELFGAKG